MRQIRTPKYEGEGRQHRMRQNASELRIEQKQRAKRIRQNPEAYPYFQKVTYDISSLNS